jgi:hypothetical protein
VTRAVIQRYARLLDRYKDDLGSRPFVVPNGDFFPDEFVGDEESVKLLVARMLEHAGMVDIPLETRIVNPGTPEAEPSKCSGFSCGAPVTSRLGFERLVDRGDGWILQIPSVELRHPVLLTTNVARSLAFVFMVETQKEGELLEPPVDVSADLIAVALGFGALMLQGSYIYAKSCGGPQVASVTKIGLGELSIAVALFAALDYHRLAPVIKHLDTTQKAVLGDARDLIDANLNLVQQVRDEPHVVSREDFSLEEPRTFLTSLLGKWKKPARAESVNLDKIDASMDLDEVESLLMDMPPSSRAGRPSRPPSRPPLNSDKERNELRDLVGEALGQIESQKPLSL